MRAHHFTTAAAIVLLFAAVAQTQTLADVARKEEERRKTVPEAAKVYTNKDLSPTAASSAPQPAASSATPAAAAKDAGKDAGKEKDAKDGKEKDANSKEIVKDKAYWAGRMKALQDQVDQNSTYVEAIQTRINALSADFVNRDDPAQRTVIERDRQKALAELARLKQAILDGKKAITTLEEDARRAGVPAGWLR